MPIPFLFLGAVAVAGLVGLVKGAEAASDNNRARELNENAQDLFDRAKSDLEQARLETTSILEDLGRVKLEVWDRQLGRFVRLFQQIKAVDLTGAVASDSQLSSISHAELAGMQKLAFNASEVLAGGAAALGTGALVGIASYGGAIMFASASTGTAISALSGAAATNATLAWFGGGSLAAGGLGMSVGAAVLGGLVAAPVLAVGGFLLAAKAEKNLAEARKNLAEAKRAAAEMEAATSVVRRIGEVAEVYTTIIQEVDRRMTPVLNDLEALIQSRRQSASWWRKLLGNVGVLDYRRFDVVQQQTVHVAMQFAQTLKKLLETPLLKQDGALDEQSVALLEELPIKALPADT